MPGRSVRSVAVSGLAILAALGLGSPEARAQAIPCGNFYQVQPGDTLREIALTAYRVGNYEAIFEANRDILSTPSLLLVGQRLFIPCIDGSGPRTRQEAEADLVQQQQLAAPASPGSPGGLAISLPPLPPEDEVIGQQAETAPEPAAPRRRGPVQTTEIIPRPGDLTRPAEAAIEVALAPQTDAQGTARPPVQRLVGRQPLQPPVGAPGEAGTAPAQRQGLVFAALDPQRQSGGQRAQAAAQPQAAAAVQGAAQSGRASPGGAGAIAGIQPAMGASARAGAALAVAGIQPAPGQSPATGGVQAPITAGQLPQAAPRPQQQDAPLRPLPGRLPNASSGVVSPNGIPLPDAPAQAAGETVLAAADATAEPAVQEQARIRILTGQYAPYTGENLPEQGMLSDVLVRALRIGAPDRPYRITFINDWAAHLSVLLPDGAFDLGYPWFKPDCSKLDMLSEAMRMRCTDYNWSQPLHEIVIGYFVAEGSPLAETTDYAALAGQRFCRPRGYYTFDLEQKGLGVPAITLVQPETPAECIQALVDGAVDVVPLSVTLVEGELASLGLAGRVAELPDLADILTLHVLSPKSNPYGRTYLTLVNRGLREMRASGEWFEVVARHLADQAAQ